MDVSAARRLDLSKFAMAMSAITLLFTFFVLMNGLKQALFKKRNEPPVVFHWLPFIGSALSYGQEPNKFLSECRAKVSTDSSTFKAVKPCTKPLTVAQYGDIFTFILFGRKITAYLGTTGNNFILNGKQVDLNPEEVYNVITAPVWGSDVVYDTPHAKYMEQKRVRQQTPISYA